MKQKNRNQIVMLGLILSLNYPIVANAQTEQGALSYLVENNTNTEKPATAMTAEEKLEGLKKRYDDSFSELSGLLNKLSTETNLLGSKELFAQFDKSDREMKSLRTSCGTYMTSLRTSAKSIKDDKSFTEDQKKELFDAAEKLDKDCEEITKKTNLATAQLAKAYSTAGTWKKIYKTYFDLQGQEKASEQVKIKIDEYLKSFTAEEKNEADSDDGDKKSDDTAAEDKDVTE